MKEIVILTESNCDGCQIVKERLTGKPNIKILDVAKDKESNKYINEDQIIVPSAVIDNARCLLKLKDGKIHAECDNGKEYKLED